MRPKLHEMGSLLKRAKASIPAVERTHDEMPSAPVATLDNDIPLDIIDENIDSEMPSAEVIFGAPTISAKPSTLEYVAEMTAADKIEAFCRKVHPTIRQFIEEDLRGKFVAVRG